MHEYKLIGEKIITKNAEYLYGAPVELKPNEEHLVLKECIAAVVTDKSENYWISKNRFKNI